MKCPFCETEDKKSIVVDRGSSTTLIGWTAHWDEDGGYHRHDPNRKTQLFSCSNGHRWKEIFKDRCPNTKCEFGSEPSIILPYWGQKL